MNDFINAPPHDDENEEMIIGCMLLDERALGEAMTEIKETMFYRRDLAVIFKAINNLYVAGKGVDLITAKGELQAMGDFDRIGGMERLRDIISPVYTATHMKTYMAKLIEDSNRRKALVYAQEIKERAYSGDYGDLINRIADIPNFEQEQPDKTTDVLLQESLLRVERRIESPDANRIGLLTGLKELDYQTGGLKKQDLIFVTAEPNVGKSILVQQICVQTALKGLNAVYFNFEMNEEYIGDRTLAMALPLDTKAIHTPSKHLTQEDYERINSTDIDKKLGERLYIYTNAKPTLQTILTKCKQLRVQKKSPDIIAVDYLQMMDAEGHSQMEKVESLSRGLKRIAKEFMCPVVAISSLSKDGQMRHSLQLKFDADIIISLAEIKDMIAIANDIKPVKVRIEKNRNGKAGGEVEMSLSLKHLMFKEVRK